MAGGSGCRVAFAGFGCAGSSAEAGAWRYSARAHDCASCALRNRCFTAKAQSRIIIIKDGHEALLRARRGIDNIAIQVYLTAAVMNLEGPAKMQPHLPRGLNSLVRAILESSRGVDENGSAVWVFFGV